MFKYYSNKTIVNGILNLNKNLINNTKNPNIYNSFCRYLSTQHEQQQQQQPQPKILSRKELKEQRISQYDALFKTKLKDKEIRPKETLEFYKLLLNSPTFSNEISVSPFDHLFLERSLIPTIAYIPLKILSNFKNLKPLKKNKLDQSFKENFIKLITAIQNNDIRTMTEMKHDQSHFMMETSRDLFHTFKEMGYDSAEKSSYQSIEPVILKFEPIIPFFDAIVNYYITISTPQPDGTKTTKKYFSTVLWRGSFPELAPGEKDPLINEKTVDFESKLIWKVGKIFVPNELSEVQTDRSNKRLLKSIENDLNKIKNK
ncbi:hypothetical protein ACTFIW_009449 [Dictyostelium discoideum]